MKIGIFTEAYYPIISGVSISIDTLSKELIKLGHEVIIITQDHDDISEKEENVFRFIGRRIPMKGLEEYRIAMVTRKKVAEIRKFNFDIIHCHTEFTMGRLGRRAAKKFNIPLVHTYHTMYEDYIHFITKVFKSPLVFIAKKYSKSFANSADQVIFPTIKVKRTFDKYGFKKPSNIIPTGIYLEKFRRINYKQELFAGLKASLGIKETDFVLLFLGRMSREKSVAALLNQFKIMTKQYPNVKLLLVGGGPDYGYFAGLVDNLGLSESVITTGMVPPSDVGLYYHISDLFVNFSITETQGLTYIESLASGLPLLVKYDDNLEGVIEEGINGFSFKEDKDFIPTFEKIYSNQILFNEISTNASKAIDRYSAENYGASVLKVYETVLRKEDDL